MMQDGSGGVDGAGKRAPGPLRAFFESPLLAALFLALLVIVGGLALFNWRQETRTQDLDRRYARSAAHFGRQVELQLEAYARVVKNLGPVGFGQAVNDARHQERVARAKNGLVGELAAQAQKQLGSAKAAVDAAEKRSRKTSERLKFLEKAALRSVNDAGTKRKAALAALGEVEAKQRDVKKAAGELERLANKLSDASNNANAFASDAVTAAEAYRKAQAEYEEFAGTQPELTPAPEPSETATEAVGEDVAEPDQGAGVDSGADVGTVSDPEPPAEPAPAPAPPPSQGKLEKLHVKAEALRKAHEKAKQDADEAAKTQEKAADAHQRQVEKHARAVEAETTAQGIADSAEAEALDVLKDSEEAGNRREAADKARSRAIKEERARAKEHVAQKKRVEDVQETLTDLQEESTAAASVVESFIDRIVQAAPPSYETKLRRCIEPVNLSDTKSGEEFERETARFTRCVFKVLLEANDIRPDQLRYVRCRHSKERDLRRLPFLAADRGAIRFPIVNNNKTLPQGCLQIPLRALLDVQSHRQSATWSSTERDSLVSVFLLDREGQALVASEGSSIRIDKLPSVALENGLASRRIPELELGASKYRAYVQPVSITLDYGCPDAKCIGKQPVSQPAAAGLMLLTLVEQDRFEDETLQLGSFDYLMASFIVALIVLAAPAAKLWSIGPRSAFRSLDVVLIASAAGVAAMLLGVTAMSIVAGSQLNAAENNQLRQVAKRLEYVLKSDFEAGSAALEIFDEETKGIAPRAPLPKDREDSACAPNDGVKRADWPLFERRWDDPPYCEKTKHSFKSKCGDRVPCLQGAWADANGAQRLKYAAGKHSAVPVIVRRRDYFKRAFAGADCREGSAPIAAEVVPSASMLRPIFVFAKATCDGKARRPNGVAAVWSKPAVLSEIVAPPGTAIAVIDDEGRVMFHTDPGVNLGHHLLDDFDDTDELRAILETQRTAFTETRYLQTPVRVYARYLEDYHWHVLTMAPVERAERPVFGMVVLTLLGSGLLFAVELGVVVLIRIARKSFVGRAPGLQQGRPRRVAFPRPKAERASLYLAGAWIGPAVVLSTASWVFLWPTRASSFRGVLLLLLLVALIMWLAPRCLRVARWVTAPHLWLKKKILERNTRPALRKWLESSPNLSMRYTGWYLGLTCLFYVAPALVVYAAAYDRVIENRARAEQIHCVATSSTRPENCAPCLLNGSCAYEDAASKGVKDRDDAYDEAKKENGFPSVDGGSHFIDLMPGYWLSQGLTGHEHRIDDDPEARQKWPWHRIDAALVLKREESPKDPSRRSLVSLLPGLSAVVSPILLFGLGLVVLGAVVVLHRTLRRLYFTDVIDEFVGVELKRSCPEDPHQLWGTLSKDERHVLTSLALYDVITPHPSLEPAVRELARIGVLDPKDLSIESAALATHIEKEHREGRIIPTRADGGWETLRTPMLAAFVVLLGALGVSEPELGAAGLLAPAFAASLPALIRALSALGNITPILRSK